MSRGMNEVIKQLTIKCCTTLCDEDAAKCSSTEAYTRKRKHIATDTEIDIDIDTGTNCVWTGPLSSLESHLLVCDFQLIICQWSGCGQAVIRKDRISHEDSCYHKLVACEYCRINLKRVEAAAHANVCFMKTAPCARGCGEMIRKDQDTAHIATACPAVVIDCPYIRFTQCDFKSIRGEMKNHLSDKSVTTHDVDIMSDSFRSITGYDAVRGGRVANTVGKADLSSDANPDNSRRFKFEGLIECFNFDYLSQGSKYVFSFDVFDQTFTVSLCKVKTGLHAGWHRLDMKISSGNFKGLTAKCKIISVAVVGDDQADRLVATEFLLPTPSKESLFSFVTLEYDDVVIQGRRVCIEVDVEKAETRRVRDFICPFTDIVIKDPIKK